MSEIEARNRALLEGCMQKQVRVFQDDRQFYFYGRLVILTNEFATLERRYFFHHVFGRGEASVVRTVIPLAIPILGVEVTEAK